MTDSTTSLARALRELIRLKAMKDAGQTYTVDEKQRAWDNARNVLEQVATHDPCETGRGDVAMGPTWVVECSSDGGKTWGHWGAGFKQLANAEELAAELRRTRAPQLFRARAGYASPPQPAAGSGEVANALRAIVSEIDKTAWHQREMEGQRQNPGYLTSLSRRLRPIVDALEAAPPAGGVPDECWREALRDTGFYIGDAEFTRVVYRAHEIAAGKGEG